MKKFKELGLSEAALTTLSKRGFEEPTPIQEKCIPILLNSTKDIIGQAQTGTGKTAAFGLPVLEMLNPRHNHIQAIILTPTRELAIQVSEELNALKGGKRIKITPIYGGQSIELQIKKLQQGLHIAVGTPGRIIDLIKRKRLDISRISFFILDEADEMLNMGFIDDIKEILEHTPAEKRTLFFSATMPNKILNLAKRYMREYKIIKIEKKQLTASDTEQIYFEVKKNDKFEALTRIIDTEPEFYGLVFCRTKLEVDRISKKLIERGYNADGLHGDISQPRREKILSRFKTKRTNILVATDVASRGIDIINLTHVINYDLPQDPESYIHRIGRTGRAGKKGTAITFVTPSEYRHIFYIGKLTKTKIRKEILPDIKEIIKIKNKKLQKLIEETIPKTEKIENIRSFAQKLLKNNDAADIISALLYLSHKTQFEEKSYIDETGNTRLFIAKGKKDGMTPGKLISFIQKKTEVEGEKIEDIRILDTFSFITVPFKEAEEILKAFKNSRTGKKPVIVKARKRT